jgi:hypothetical protein
MIYRIKPECDDTDKKKMKRGFFGKAYIVNEVTLESQYSPLWDNYPLPISLKGV